MKLQQIIVSAILLALLLCSSNLNGGQSVPIARFGTTPTIDGVFGDGEWDDAEVVKVDSNWRFRMKHDGVNLYFALDGAGGNIWLKEDDAIRVLHASFAVNVVEYARSDSSGWARSKEPVNGLFGLQKETAATINERMTGYLAENNWVASLIPMGNMTQTEFAVSFDYLGIAGDPATVRFAEIPWVYIFSALNVPPDELAGRAGWWDWPGLRETSDELLRRGHQPDKISADAIEWGRIKIDLRTGA
jgi:hypothetical protein